MSQLSKNIQTDLLGQIFLELYQFKTRSLFLGHHLFLMLMSEASVLPGPF